MAELTTRNYHGIVFIECGKVLLYQWNVQPRHYNLLNGSKRSTQKQFAVYVEPCGSMLTNITERWKYSHTMSLEQGYYLLTKMGVDTKPFVDACREKGWGEVDTYLPMYLEIDGREIPYHKGG